MSFILKSIVVTVLSLGVVASAGAVPLAYAASNTSAARAYRYGPYRTRYRAECKADQLRHQGWYTRVVYEYGGWYVHAS